MKKFAKIQNADVYISLHTDSHNNSKISGTTVYRLSNLDVNNNEVNIQDIKFVIPDEFKHNESADAVGEEAGKSPGQG